MLSTETTVETGLRLLNLPAGSFLKTAASSPCRVAGKRVILPRIDLSTLA